MRTVTAEELRQTIADVDQAGRVLRAAQADVAWTLKPDGSFVTDLDRRIEDDLRGRLMARFPGCDFVGEEGTPLAGRDPSRPCIVLDPIDGTAAFARGLNFYAISLAVLQEDGRPLLAVLHLPAMQRWAVAAFTAEGAVLYAVDTTGTQIAVRPQPPRAPRDWPDWSASYLYLGSDPHLQLDLSRWEGKVRALGATAAHLGLLLDDTLDPIAVVVTRYKIWDVAAGLALAEAAGFDALDLRSPDRTLSLSELWRSEVLPPLVVARPAVLERLLPAIALRDSRG